MANDNCQSVKASARSRATVLKFLKKVMKSELFHRLFCFLLLYASCSTSQSAGVESQEWIWRNPTPQGDDLNAVNFDGTRFLAVTVSGGLLVSTNGLSWSVRDSGLGATLSAIAFGNDRYVAAGNSHTLGEGGFVALSS